MREEGKAKLGFFPAPPQALDLLLTRLTASPEAAVIDPCAGEAVALKHLLTGLGLSNERAWAIELEKARGETVRANLPGAQVLAPASFFGCRIQRESLSLVYCNPPFSIKWLEKCTGLLCPYGVLCFVIPENFTYEFTCREHMATHYDHITVLAWPEEFRHHHEIFLLAVKRKTPLERVDWRSWDQAKANPGYTYHVPPAPGPGEHFVKTELTDAEVEELLEASPLNRHMEVPPIIALPRPPLALSTGHVALLLATGNLDGIVCPPDGEPHVIRGVAKKVEEVSAEETVESKAETVTKTTYTERILMSVRAVDAKGEIHTLV